MIIKLMFQCKKLMSIVLFIIPLWALAADKTAPRIVHRPKAMGAYGKANTIEAVIGGKNGIESVEITFQYQNSKGRGRFPVQKSGIPVLVTPIERTPLYSKANSASRMRDYVNPGTELQVYRVVGSHYLVVSSDQKAGFIPARQTRTVLQGQLHRITLPASFCQKERVQYQIHAVDRLGNQKNSAVFQLAFKTEDEIFALMQGKKAPRRRSNTMRQHPSDPKTFGGLALFFKGGTVGGGAGIAKSIHEKLNIRAAYNYFRFNYSGIVTDMDPVDLNYDVNLKLTSISGLLDYYPFGNAFHLTGGLYYNKNHVKGSGEAADSVLVNDENTYTPEQIGELTIHLNPNTVWTPYIGLGFGNPVKFGKKVGFFMDLGAIYQGSPKVDFTADEGAIIEPTTEEDVKVEENIKMYKWFPVFQLGLSIQL